MTKTRDKHSSVSTCPRKVKVVLGKLKWAWAGEGGLVKRKELQIQTRIVVSECWLRSLGAVSVGLTFRPTRRQTIIPC